MQVRACSQQHLAAAADLFVQNLKGLRDALPQLPSTLEDGRLVEQNLARTMCPGVAAFDGDQQLLGYLGWFVIEDFRGTGLRAAYVPEWAHAAGRDKTAVYRALYREAAARWSEAGCRIHALTLLANDRLACDTWFWNGFGLAVVDAVRPLQPFGAACPTGFGLRKATASDCEEFCRLDAEHLRHYSQPPTLMAERPPRHAAEYRALLAGEKNSIWLATAGESMTGFMVFEGGSFGADIVNGDDTLAVTGAYVRPAYRGRGLASALLDAALRDYAARGGFARCAVDFESFNVDAAAFWPRYFETACLSLMRIPEKV